MLFYSLTVLTSTILSLCCGQLIEESPHPYLSNQNSYKTIAVEGAIGYTIKFDPNSNILSSDGLIFYKDATYKDFWGSFWYAGDYASGA